MHKNSVMNDSADGFVRSETGDLGDDYASPSQLREVEGSEKIVKTSSKRPKEVKAAKVEKRDNMIEKDGDEAFHDAIHSLSTKFGEVSSATIAAANARHGEAMEQADRAFQLKKDADELKAVPVLFKDDGEDNKMYRNTVQRKRLCKLLEDEGRSLKCLRPPSFSGGEVDKM